MGTPEEELTAPQEQVREGRQVTGAQVALIVGGAIVLLALFWFLFLRGGGDDAPEGPISVPQPAQPTVTPTAEPTTQAPGDRPPVETFEVFAPRDPFEPLIDLTEGGGQDTGEDAEDGGEDVDGDGDVDEEDGAPTEPDDGAERVEGHTVKLVATLEDGTVQIQVDDTVYTVEEGETFAENFKLVSISGECATVLFGDDQFSICEGEEILK
ncbi:MAG: hypothetical protein M3280_07890 [Actinomycetota bacterium]|nr:hypothetical protein [Actinomycetota bacterium]